MVSRFPAPARARRGYGLLFLMMVPGLAYYLVNNYLPLAGLVIAFKQIDYSQGIFGSPWVGLENFRFLFQTEDAFVITRNTLLYNGAFILINLVLALGLAVLLNEVTHKKLLKVYLGSLLVPYLISMVIVGYLVFALLGMDTGFLNKTVLPALGIEDVFWYSEPRYWPVILVLVNAWKNVGYLAVIYYVAILAVPVDYYEAARIDGASRRQQILRITLPSIAPVVAVMTLLQIGRIFYSDFGLFYQVPLDSGPLLPVTNVIDTYVYRALLNTGDIGMSSAAGLYQSVVGFVLVFASNFIVKKVNPDNALF